MSRGFLIGAAVVAAATAWAGVAAGGNAGSTTVLTMPVSFTLSAAVCDDITSDVTGEGTAHVNLHESVDANGVVHFAITTVVNGTAEDENGGTYRFSYHNTEHFNFSGFPVLIYISDHFNLVGNGGANHSHSFFNLLISVADETDPGTFLRATAHGDPMHCDPI
jgi:hypothetical protein